jgi:HSP20 family molecular chaperone IbpA
MSELSVSGAKRDQQRQLEDLKQEHEQKLTKLRAEQKRREDQTRTEADATVNHIRKSSGERIENLRSESDQKLRREEESIRKNYNSLKKRAIQQYEGLERDVAEASDRSRAVIQGLKESDTKAMRRSQEKLREFLEDQAELKANTTRKVNAEIDNAERTGTEQILKARKTANEERREIEAEHKTALDEIRNRNRASYDEARDQARNRLEQVRRESSDNLDKERTQSHTNINEVRKRYQDAVNREQRDGDRRLNDLAKKNQERFEQLRDRAITVGERNQAEYSAESARIAAEGDKEINKAREKFDALRKQQEFENAEALRKMREEFEEKDRQLNSDARARAAHVTESLGKTLNQKIEDFKKRFEKTDLAHRESLNNQEEIFLKQQYKQQISHDAKANLANDRADDPFYRLKGFDAKLIENPDHYILEAKIPAYEKDSVAVRVKDDKITLTGRRAHEDEHRDGNVRVSTNNHQTWMQEFQLGAPADPKSVHKQLKDDGSIEVFVSKKGYAKKV